MNKSEVMEQLGHITQLRVRDIEHTPRTRVTVASDGETMSLRPNYGQPIVIPPASIAKLLGYAGVPSGVAKRLTPDTLGRAVTECLGAQERYGLVLRGNEMTDIVKPGERHGINAERVLNTVERVIPDVDFHRINLLSPHKVNLEMVGVQERPVVKGDLVRAGVSLTFSPIGIEVPEVQAFALRLACTNGATALDSLSRYNYEGEGNGNGGSFYPWLNRSIREAYGALGSIVERWKQMREEGISPTDRAAVLEALIRQSKLPIAVANEVRAMAMAEPPQNNYDAFNLLTWASSHRLEGAQVAHAQRIGAQFASETGHRRICPVCHHQNN